MTLPGWRGWTEADERAWQAKYAAEKAAEEEAYRARNGEPPRHSKVYGPPADWKRWAALLDGFPVAHCYEFDLDENWVQVYVVAENKTGVCRILDTPQRRLHGRVEAVPFEEWNELRKTRESIVIDTERLRGDPIPGTELRMRKSA